MIDTRPSILSIRPLYSDGVNQMIELPSSTYAAHRVTSVLLGYLQRAIRPVVSVVLIFLRGRLKMLYCVSIRVVLVIETALDRRVYLVNESVRI